MRSRIVRRRFVLLSLLTGFLLSGCLPSGPHVKLSIPGSNAPRLQRVQAYKKYRTGFRGDYCKVFSHSTWEDKERDTEECRKWKEKRPQRFAKYCLEKVETRHFRYTAMGRRAYCKGQQVSYREVPHNQLGSRLRLKNGQEIVHPSDLIPAVLPGSRTAQAIRGYYSHHEHSTRALISMSVSLAVMVTSVVVLAVVADVSTMPLLPVLGGVAGLASISSIISGTVLFFQHAWREEAKGRAFANYERDLKARLGLAPPRKPLLKPTQTAP